MRIQDVKLYINPGEPKQWQVSSRGRGGIDFVPPGLSGLMTHTLGFRAQREDEIVEYSEPEPRPTYTTTLRLVTDGNLDAYAEFGSGCSADELARQARYFRAIIAPMLIGVDAFDREYVWQRMWYMQRFFYTGRQNVEMVYRGLYYYTQAHHRGEATDVVSYLATHAKLLGFIKRPRKPPAPQRPEDALDRFIQSLTCD
jgi:hypothetical protein